MTETEYQSAMRGGSKFDKAMYARRPDKEPHARWIVTVSRTNLEDYLIRGFIPLWQYGYANQPGDLNKWQRILQHPAGPAEFPVEQVMTLRWYKDEDCPVPGTKFPQLAGHKIKEYKCPECRRTFEAHDGLGGIEPLGVHLKYLHSWDRPSIIKYGEKVGIDFDAIYSSIEKTYEFEPEAVEKKPVEVDKSGLLVGEFDCDQCDWKPNPKKKLPGVALIQHKRHAHPQPEAA